MALFLDECEPIRDNTEIVSWLKVLKDFFIPSFLHFALRAYYIIMHWAKH